MPSRDTTQKGWHHFLPHTYGTSLYRGTQPLVLILKLSKVRADDCEVQEFSVAQNRISSANSISPETLFLALSCHNWIINYSLSSCFCHCRCMCANVPLAVCHKKTNILVVSAVTTANVWYVMPQLPGHLYFITSFGVHISGFRGRKPYCSLWSQHSSFCLFLYLSDCIISPFTKEAFGPKNPTIRALCQLANMNTWYSRVQITSEKGSNDMVKTILHIDYLSYRL